MGLALSFIPFLDECHRQGALSGPILGLGDIKFHESSEALHRFAIADALPRFNVDHSVGTFFSERYGVGEYLDCDLHDRADFKVDLAAALSDDLLSRFGVILNAGTLEHIFDQRAAYENVHSMLRPGGVIVHLAPVTWYEHAYYNYNPLLFRDIARANNYSLVAEAFHGRHADECVGCVFTFKNGRREDAADRYASFTDKPALSAHLLYMAAYRKPMVNERFRVPYDVAEVAPEVESQQR